MLGQLQKTHRSRIVGYFRGLSIGEPRSLCSRAETSSEAAAQGSPHIYWTVGDESGAGRHGTQTVRRRAIWLLDLSPSLPPSHPSTRAVVVTHPPRSEYAVSARGRDVMGAWRSHWACAANDRFRRSNGRSLTLQPSRADHMRAELNRTNAV